jgi:hypothetical protein
MISTCLNDVKHNKKNLSLEISKELYKIGVSNKVKDHFYYTRNLIFTEDIAALLHSSNEVFFLESFEIETGQTHITMITVSGEVHKVKYKDEVQNQKDSYFPDILIRQIKDWNITKPKNADFTYPLSPVRAVYLEKINGVYAIKVAQINYFIEIE